MLPLEPYPTFNGPELGYELVMRVMGINEEKLLHCGSYPTITQYMGAA